MAKKVEFSKQQQEYIGSMQSAIEKCKQLKGSTGYVAAGYAGDVYYCYVGEGKGFQGSCFFPMTSKAVVFGTEQEAQDHCYKGYRNVNGNGDLLDLHPVKAPEFFDKVLDHYQKQLNWAVDMWSKQVGRM